MVRSFAPRHVSSSFKPSLQLDLDVSAATHEDATLAYIKKRQTWLKEEIQVF